MSELIRQDVLRIKELGELLALLDKRIYSLTSQSKIGKRLLTIKGYGSSSCETLIGEISNIDRFEKESSLAFI